MSPTFANGGSRIARIANRRRRRTARVGIAARPSIVAFICSVLALATSALAQQNASVMNSPHNLSAYGPGAIRASSEQEVCIFCHTPHNASPIQPVWNRNMPVSAYTVYSSNSLEAAPGQPTGSSKLCLSCHDGSIAVGSVLSRQQPIAMAGGVTTLPPGTSNLGTDLSDDHPISFRYDADLATRDPKIKPPATLPPKVRLDARGEMQCTSCHDAHDNSNGSFLVISNTQSQLCNACHQVGHTTIAAHSDCADCHQQHSAPSGAHLLKGLTPTDTCGACHGGSTIAAPAALRGQNVMADLNKIARHGNPNPTAAPVIRMRVAQKDPTAVTCADCHESHTMQSGAAGATALQTSTPQISPSLGEISGVNAAGALVAKAQFAYEVCFKCHADQNVVQPRTSRLIAQPNVRLQFAPSAVSMHPVETAGKNADVPSLRPGLTSSSTIACSDCHASESSKSAGGAGPNGPHGSNVASMLSAGYETTDGTSESAAAYALCYRCHERNSILTDQSFAGHQNHIVNQRTPCSVCHDAHGISSAQGNAINNAHLINFDISVVQADPVSGRLEYRARGPRRGECFLSCHGVPHSPKSYPVNAANPIPDAAKVKTPRPAAPTPAPPTPAPPMQPLRRGRSTR